MILAGVCTEKQMLYQRIKTKIMEIIVKDTYAIRNEILNRLSMVGEL